MSEHGPTRSADGNWEWDGQAWQPVAHAAPAATESATPPWSAQQYAVPAPAARGGSGLAITGFVLGIVSLIAWLLPIIGLPVAIIGLVLSFLGTRGSSRGLAIAGIVVGAIGLILGLINAAIGAYLGATGQMQFPG